MKYNYLAVARGLEDGNLLAHVVRLATEVEDRAGRKEALKKP
jgi:hypothetical protein